MKRAATLLCVLAAVACDDPHRYTRHDQCRDILAAARTSADTMYAFALRPGDQRVGTTCLVYLREP